MRLTHLAAALATAAVLIGSGLWYFASAQQKNARPADLIASAGHGLVFDATGQQLTLDPPLALEIQGSMREVLTTAGVIPRQHASLAKRADTFLQQAQPSPEEKVIANHVILEATLVEADAKLRARYRWRARTVFDHFIAQRPKLLDHIHADLLSILRDLFRDLPREPGNPHYAQECRERGVPVPPDWAESGTAWQRQGTLTSNLLQPGQHAEVWTYQDPAIPGGCIALPRGSGDPGSPAGIICQGATGYACFWDNILASEPMERFMGWRGRTLVISELKNGSNLDSPCTTCHRGNNVFNISPDDPTWGRVLRALPTTTSFTTQLTSSPDTYLGRPRYVPYTAATPRAGWNNPLPASTACGGCHEYHPATFSPPSPMPPACMSLPGGCYAP